MSTKANSTDQDRLTSNDPLMEEFERGQRSSRMKGVAALTGVAVFIAFLIFYFGQLAAV